MIHNYSEPQSCEALLCMFCIKIQVQHAPNCWFDNVCFIFDYEGHSPE